MSEECLLLKWGTLKGWEINNEDTLSILRQYIDLGVQMGCMQGKDTAKQKTLICQLIDQIDGSITNDWTGEDMSKDEAKKYVTEYRR